MRGKKWMKRKRGEVEPIPSKCDHIKVALGDELFYQTWGAGGYGDALTREVERVEKDVRFRLVSVEKAKASYGVVIDKKTMKVDKAATEKLRAELKAKRGEPKPFDFGPSLTQILKNCKKETGLEPARPPVFKKVVSGMPVYKPKPSQVRIVPREDGQKRVAKAARRARA
jgi:hypothetical protein